MDFLHLRLKSGCLPPRVELLRRSCLGRLFPILVLISTLTSTSAIFAQRGALTAPESIDQLSEEATLIVHGHVTSAKVEPHPQLSNLMTVVVTVEGLTSSLSARSPVCAGTSPLVRR